MSGTKEGGRRAVATTKALHGNDFYKRVGAKGGRAKVKKGFAMMDKARLSAISSIGGKLSKRGKAKKWSKSSTSSSSITKHFPCQSCGNPKPASELDDMQLCANCPQSTSTKPTTGRPF